MSFHPLGTWLRPMLGIVDALLSLDSQDTLLEILESGQWPPGLIGDGSDSATYSPSAVLLNTFLGES